MDTPAQLCRTTVVVQNISSVLTVVLLGEAVPATPGPLRTVPLGKGANPYSPQLSRCHKSNNTEMLATTNLFHATLVNNYRHTTIVQVAAGSVGQASQARNSSLTNPKPSPFGYPHSVNPRPLSSMCCFMKRLRKHNRLSGSEARNVS